MVEYDKYQNKIKRKTNIRKKEDSYCVRCRKKNNNKNIKGVALEKIGQQK